MADLNQWIEVESESKYLKWEEKGQLLEGKLISLKDGDMGKLGTIAKADGAEISFSCPTMLLNKLTGLESYLVRIQYDGQFSLEDGRKAKRFRVWKRG